MVFKTKANRSLGFIKRNLKRCPEQIKDQAYKSLVRPHLEYASSVWSPHQKYQVDKLERVQRKAARFVKNCWIREEGVMTNMLSDLKWDSLQTRREKARLVMFYRVTHGLVDIPLPKDLLPMPYKNTRNFHPKKYRPLACNTNYYMGTFFPSTVNIWNTLPAATLDQPNIAKFKDELENKKCGNYYKILSKTMTLLYIITKTVQFNYIRSSPRQVPREIQPCIKDFPA